MPRLTDLHSYADAQAQFSSEKLWELFDGNREQFNIAAECIDRHASSGRDALIVAHADGRDEVITYAELSADSSRFAHWLATQNVQPGHAGAIAGLLHRDVWHYQTRCDCGAHVHAVRPRWRAPASE